MTCCCCNLADKASATETTTACKSQQLMRSCVAITTTTRSMHESICVMRPNHLPESIHFRAHTHIFEYEHADKYTHTHTIFEYEHADKHTHTRMCLSAFIGTNKQVGAITAANSHKPAMNYESAMRHVICGMKSVCRSPDAFQWTCDTFAYNANNEYSANGILLCCQQDLFYYHCLLIALAQGQCFGRQRSGKSVMSTNQQHHHHHHFKGSYCNNCYVRGKKLKTHTS